jgi:D-alanine-D-alanine ligase
MHKYSLPQPVKVAILHDGLSTVSDESFKADVQDTLDTVENIKQALSNRGHQVVTHEVTQGNIRKVVNVDCDVLFNLVEDHGWVLAHKTLKLLEKKGAPVVGSDLEGLINTNDKTRVKKAMMALGIPTPKFQIFKSPSVKLDSTLMFPLIVKPAREHAGTGISQESVVTSITELEKRLDYLRSRFPGEIIVEEYIDGREIHATVLGNGEVHVMPLAEIRYTGEFEKNWKIYSYEAKWDQNSWEYWNAPVDSPAKLDKKTEDRIVDLAKKSFRDLNARDYIRFDMRLTQSGQIYIVDVNTNPSLKLDPLDATWASAQALGWSYEDLIESIAGLAYHRNEKLKTKNQELVI